MVAILGGSIGLATAFKFGVGFGLSLSLAAAGFGFFAARRLLQRSRASEETAIPLLWLYLLGIPAMAGLLIVVSYHSYGRPWHAFGLAFVMALSVSFLAWSIAAQRPVIVLIQATVMTAAFMLSRLTVFETVGGDSFFHRIYIESIVATGSTQAEPTVYATFPLLHMGAAQLVNLLGISASDALTFYTLVPYLACLWLVFAIGSIVHSPAVGAWAAVILGTSRWFLYWGATETPMQAALALYLLGVLLLLEYQRRRTFATGILLVLVLAAGSFLHPFGAIALAVVCIAFTLTGWSVKTRAPGSHWRAPWALAVLSFVLPVSVWIYHGIAFERIVPAVARAIAAFEGAFTVATQRDTIAYELDHLSDNLLFAVAGLACLLLIGTRRRTPHAPEWLQLGALFVICALLGIGGDVLGLVGLVGFRWLLFAVPLAALLAAWLIVQLSSRVASAYAAPLMSVLVAGYALAGVANGSVAQDAPPYGQESTALADLTADDISLNTYVARLDGINVAADREMVQALSAMRLGSGTQLITIHEEAWPPRSNAAYSAVVLRQADFERRMALTRPVQPDWWMDTPNAYARIYDNGGGGLWVEIVRSEPAP